MEESKFKVLLDPIKDLAASWDIDIDDCLNEYLEELDGLNLDASVVGGKGGINFATAALLIQGSTAVYSKKVEFLHQLVLQALDVISTKKSSETKGRGGKGSKATAHVTFDEERLLFGTDPSYLLLDDLVEEGANIDLVETDVMAADENKGGKDRRRSSKGRHSVSGDFSRASTVLMHSVLQEDHGGSNLRMSSCVMDTSGALMIGGLLPERTGRGLAPLAALGLAQGNINPSLMSAQFRNDGGAAPMAVAAMNDYGQDDEMVVDFGGGGWDDDGGDNDYGGYPDDVDEDPLQVGRRLSVSRLGIDDPDTDAAGRAIAPPAMSIHAPTSSNLFGTKKPTKPLNKNALTLLDPHEVTKGSRPVKKGRPYKIPPPSTPSIATALATGDDDTIRACMKNIGSFGLPPAPFAAYDPYILGGKPIPRAGLVNKFFAPILKQNRRETASLARSSGGGYGAAEAAQEREASHGRNAEFFLYKDPASTTDEALGVGEGCGGENVYDDDDGGFWGDDDDHDDGGLGDPMVDEGAPTDDARPLCHPEDAAFDIFQDIDEDMARRVEEALNEGLSQSQGNTYESICRQHIDSFMRGAEQYARETQLSKRVTDWTNRLEPMLRAQEDAPEFDIHTYSDLVLNEVDAVLRMDPHRRLSELGLGLLDLTDFENREANISHQNGSDDAAGEDGVENRDGRRSSLISPDHLAALQSALANDVTVVDFAEIVHAAVRKSMVTSSPVGGLVMVDDPEEYRLKTSAEVCRIFLACLMLANMGNLDVVPPSATAPEGGSNSMNSMNTDSKRVPLSASATETAMNGYGNFAVRLLDHARKKGLETFRAPSVMDDDASLAVAATATATAGPTKKVVGGGKKRR